MPSLHSDLTGTFASAQEAAKSAPISYPPPTNRGVERTDPTEPRLIMDWFSYTVPEDVSIDDAVPVGADREWTALDHGDMGYLRSAISDGIRVYYDGSEGMGKHISLSGSACAALEATYGDELAAMGGWLGYAGKMDAAGYNVTRFDGAVDERRGRLKMSVLREWAEAERYTSSWQQFRTERSRRRRGDDFGETLYFGAPSSECRARIYDKSAERRSKGEDVKGPWVRTELQTRGAAARALVRLLAASEDPLSTFLGVMRQKLDFKLPSSTDTNLRRAPTVAWWDNFLQQTSKLRLSVPPSTRTLDTVLAWLHRQCAPSLALALEAAKNDPRVIRLLIDDGRDRLRPRHRALLTPRVA